MENWPLVGDRYDPYDPAHPMWADPFWSRYAAGSPVPASEPAAEASPGVAGDGPPV